MTDSKTHFKQNAIKKCDQNPNSLHNRKQAKVGL